MHRFRDIV